MILFLDIDGVLHPLIPRKDRPASEAAQLSYLPRLADVLSLYPDVQIVISSTWRTTRTLDQLRALFPVTLQHRLIGVTPVLDESRYPGGREIEALAWLDAHSKGEEWIALDDCAPCWTSLWRLVICDDGFRDAEERELREMIERWGKKK